MKKQFTKAVTLTAATTMLIGTIPFTEMGVLAGESRYPAMAAYNEIQADIYDELDTANAENSGKWGTCDWSIDDKGVLTISGGRASESVKKTSTNTAGYEWVSPWESNGGGVKKVVIEDKITFMETK